MSVYFQLAPISTSSRDWFDTITSTVISANPDRLILENSDGTRTYLWSALIGGNLNFNASANALTGTINWITHTDAGGAERETYGDIFNNLGLDAASFWNAADRYATVFGGTEQVVGFDRPGTWNSTFSGSQGGDQFDGGGGIDTVDYRLSQGPLTLDLANPANSTGDAAGDSYIGIDVFLGTASNVNHFTGDSGDSQFIAGDFNDLLIGGDGRDELHAAAGNDRLEGGAGDDVLIGGAGHDLLMGGLGSDIIAGIDLNGTLNFDDDVVSYADHDTPISVTITPAGNGTVVGANGEVDQLIRIYDIEGGSAGDTIVTQSGGPHNVWGLGGDDSIRTMNGGGWVNGGVGNDTLYDVSFDDSTVSFMGLAQGVQLALSTFDWAQAISGAEIDSIRGFKKVEGTDHNDLITGNGFPNTIWGGAGIDILDGATGEDTIYGGDGADTIICGIADFEIVDGGNGRDTVSFAGTVRELSLTIDESGNGRFTIIPGSVFYTSIENLSGGTAIDRLNGNSSDNDISGVEGNDILEGRGGFDVLDGGIGDDVLNGGAGDDVLLGQGGIDTADYWGASGGVNVNLAIAGPQNTGGAGIDRLSLIENVRGTNSVALLDTLIGDAGDNRLEGWDGSDALWGGLGGDTLDGGLYSDALFGEGGNDTLIGGNDDDDLTGGLDADTLLGGFGDDDFFFSQFDANGDSIDGGANTDTIRLLTNGLHDFRMSSIAGIEAVDMDGGANQPDMAAAFKASALGAGLTSTLKVTGEATGGSAIIFSFDGTTAKLDLSNLAFVQWSSDDSVQVQGDAIDETVTGSSQADIMGLGGGADVASGGAGNDVLDGGSGADILNGGIGDDTYVVDSADDLTNELKGEGVDRVETALSSWTLASEVEDLSYTGKGGNFIGKGNVLSNRVTGGTGDDRFLMDGGGSDRYEGGDGMDTVDFRLLGAVIVNLANNTNGGAAAGEVFVSVEQVLGSATADDTLTAGSTGATLAGYGGRDILRGGAGDDVLYGGLGDDRIDGGAARDRALKGDEGNDIITGGDGDDSIEGGSEDDILYGQAGRDSARGGAGADTLYGGDEAGAGDVALAGDAGIDWISGGLGNDRIDGGADSDRYLGGDGGEDVITGGLGNDRLEGGGDDDILYGQEDSDYVLGGLGADTLYGGTGIDYLYGNDGNDFLQGDAQNDNMYGGAGLDRFNFNLANGSDVIFDFTNDQDTLIIDPLFGFANAAAVVAATIQTGNHARLLLPGADTDIYLWNYLTPGNGNTIANLVDDILIA